MDLIDCIAFIKAELNKLPAPDHSTPEARADRQKAKAAMIATIEQSLPKAKINDKWNGASVSIAGVRASSTSGIVALFTTGLPPRVGSTRQASYRPTAKRRTCDDRQHPRRPLPCAA